MKIADLQAALTAGLPALFEFESEPMPDGSIAVLTPFVCNDGTTPYIFVSERDGGGYVLSDGCEMLGGLSQRTGCRELSSEQRGALAAICRETPGLELKRGELKMRCECPQELAGVVLRLGQAMLRVSDLWFLEDAAGPGVVVGIEDGATGTATTTAAAKERVG